MGVVSGHAQALGYPGTKIELGRAGRSPTGIGRIAAIATGFILARRCRHIQGTESGRGIVDADDCGIVLGHIGVHGLITVGEQIEHGGLRDLGAIGGGGALRVGFDHALGVDVVV